MRILLVLPLLAAAAPARAAAPDPWADWAPLLGSWVADATPGGPTGGFTLEKALGGQVLLRHNHAETPATKDRPASAHEDLLVIYPEHGATRADYFDNEGHVIHYAVTLTPAAHRLVLESDARKDEPRFRLTYDYADKDALAFTFDIARPGATSYATYLQARIHRAPR